MKMVILLVSLIVLNTVTALGVVRNQYHKRSVGIEHAQLSEEKDFLIDKWTQLLIEYASWSANPRIERIAVEQLGMKHEYDNYSLLEL